jgi:hypothetical protein
MPRHWQVAKRRGFNMAKRCCSRFAALVAEPLGSGALVASERVTPLDRC